MRPVSYLGPIRLHFAGRFQASVSTINNAASNFDPANFSPDMQVVGGPGGWNPAGDADFRLIGCDVTAAYGPDGEEMAADPVLDCLVADSDRSVPGKLVDLDPHQQLASQIWGVEIRICDSSGTNLVIGRFDVTPFKNLWSRGPEVTGDFPYGAFYQSVLTDLEWGDVSRSPFMTALQDAASDGLLSVKFNVDGFNHQPGTEGYTYGRAVGTVGPAAEHEPRRFVAGRQLRAVPGSPLNDCSAVLDEASGKLFVDLGNSLPTQTPGGPLDDIGAVTLAAPADLGAVPYTAPGFYERDAGVVALPEDRALTAAEVTTLRAAPLVIAVDGRPALAETPAGRYVRADQFVFRLDPGEPAEVTVHATEFGAPLATTEIAIERFNGGLQSNNAGNPPGGIELPEPAKTDEHGVVTFTVKARDPGRPRAHVDGQVYGVRPRLTGASPNSSDFVSLLVFSAFPLNGPPTWQQLEPIFKQYANLYPVMSRFLDLADEESVRRTRDLLRLSFALPLEDPNSMPVTRDLSKAKRRAIIAWLDSLPAPDPAVPGETPPPQIPARGLRQALGVTGDQTAEPRAADVPGGERGEDGRIKGGKELALERRKGPEPEAER